MEVFTSCAGFVFEDLHLFPRYLPSGSPLQNIHTKTAKTG